MSTLRQELEASSTLLAPGVYDALSAHIAQRAGFRALYLSGFAVAGSLLAKPDIGLVTGTEMIQRVGQVVAAAGGLPVIADGDNGYGGIHNVERLVQAYELAGASAIQLEDQVSPKRCGHMDNKEVVSMQEAADKIAAACNSRQSAEFLIIARTDARATDNLDEAIRRAKAYQLAGADVLFVEAPQSIEEMHEIRAAFPDIPLVANMVEDGKTPDLELTELADLGFQLVLRPVAALLAVARNLEQSYASLKGQGSLQDDQPRLTFHDYNTMLGLQDYLLKDEQFQDKR